MWLRVTRFIFGLLLIMLLFSACASGPDLAPAFPWEKASNPLVNTPDDDLYVGVGRVDITPTKSVMMGGYGAYMWSLKNCRWSQGVHDPLYASAIYFQRGRDQLLLVTVDLLGLPGVDIREIRTMISKELPIDYERVIISASHTHHGPDTVGLWGTIQPAVSGRDETYMIGMKRQLVAAAQTALASRQPATMHVAVGSESETHENIRRAEDPQAPIDDTVTVLAVKDKAGQIFATLTNWGCHPTTEDGDNLLLSSDWVGAFRQTLSAKIPATHIFIQGAIGGAIQPSPAWRDKNVGPNWKNFAWANAVGSRLGEKVSGLLAQTKPLEFKTIDVHHAPVRTKQNNAVYALGKSFGLLNMDVPGLYQTYYSELTAVRMGALRLGTMPGEMMPDIGKRIRANLKGEAQILIGLGQDWMGYIVDREHYFDKRYAYERFLCAGSQWGENIIKEYQALAFE